MVHEKEKDKKADSFFEAHFDLSTMFKYIEIETMPLMF